MKKALLLLVSTAALAAGCHSGGSSKGSAASDPAAAVSVAADPMLPFYPVASDVSLTATVTDAKGNALPNAAVTWTLDPPNAAAPSTTDGAFTLQNAGPITFKACAAEQGDGGAPVCGELVLEVAPAAPVLLVNSPPRGAELGGSGASTFTVKGQVTSTRAAQVFVDGVAAQLASDGTFSADVPATFGINHLVVSATDGENPEVRDERDVAFGASYATAVDATGAPSLAVSDAIILQLGQRFFDDGVPVPLDAPHPVVLPTLADVVTRLVTGLDLLSKIPNPVVSNGAIVLQATSVKLDDVTTQVNLQGDGIDLYVNVGAVSLGTTGSIQVAGTTISLDGGVNASVAAYAHASITKASPTDPVVVTVGTFDVVLETATGAFTDPQANAVFDLASGFLRTTIQTELQNALASTLQSTVPSALQGVFQSLDNALANRTFDINVAPLPEVKLNLDGHLSEVDIVPLDWMKAVLPLSVTTSQSKAAHPTSRGVALIDTSDAQPLFESPRTQLGIRLLVLNGLLHTLWNSGLLEVPVSSTLPVQASGKLAPIVRLPRAGETHDLVVSLGEVEVIPNGDATRNGRMGVLIEGGIDIDLASETLSLKLADTPTVTVWIIDPPSGTTIFTPSLLTTVVTGVLWPKLQSGIESALSITLPIPPLDSLASLAPSLTGLTLTTGLNHKVAYRNGFLVLDADLSATLP